jgi:biopolymer transport protein ExbD
MNITVPKAETAGKNQLTGSVEIAVDKEGKIFVNGKETSEQNLEALLKQIQSVNRDTPVLLRADETSQFGKVMLLLDTCRKIGLSKVVMQARK